MAQFISTYSKEEEFEAFKEKAIAIYPPNHPFSRRINSKAFPQWCVITQERVDGSVPHHEIDSPIHPFSASSLTHYIMGADDQIIGTVWFENYEYVARDNNGETVWQTNCQTKFLTSEAIASIERGEYCRDVNIVKNGFLDKVRPIQINWLPTSYEEQSFV